MGRCLQRRPETGKIDAFDFTATFLNSWLDTDAELEGDDLEDTWNAAAEGRYADAACELGEGLNEAISEIGGEEHGDDDEEDGDDKLPHLFFRLISLAAVIWWFMPDLASQIWSGLGHLRFW